MTMSRLLSVAQRRLRDLFQTAGPWSRGAWCRRQRRHLGTAAGRVVWIRGAPVSWAEWGARRGYFDIQYMDGLPYLRASGAPASRGE
jgi:hypothetical protein